MRVSDAWECGKKWPKKAAMRAEHRCIGAHRLHSAPMLAQSAGSTEGIIWTGRGSP